MAWTNLGAAFGYGSKLTSAQMQNLRDNITALANGDSGAPLIQSAAMQYLAGNVRKIGAGTAVSYWDVLGVDGTWRRCSNYIDESGGGTCFPAGSMVLMADLSWRPIELVGTGDIAYSHPSPAEIARLYVTRLGHRRMFRMADNSILWSEEHSFWVLRHDATGGREFIWTISRSELEREQRQGIISGLPDFSLVFNGNPGQAEEFAWLSTEGHRHTWKRNTPLHIPEYDGKADFPLYLPLTNDGKLIVVNGYFVGAAINGYITDYTKLRWRE